MRVCSESEAESLIFPPHHWVFKFYPARQCQGSLDMLNLLRNTALWSNKYLFVKVFGTLRILQMMINLKIWVKFRKLVKASLQTQVLSLG